MTRSEFAALAIREWHVEVGQSLYDKAKQWNHPLLTAIADVATNGFDPEPTEATTRFWKAYCCVCKDGLEGMNHTDASAAAFLKAHSVLHTKGDNVMPASRPFVGSHNLPYDCDVDD